MQAALDELRRELGTDRVALGELIVLGAGAKLAAIREQERGDAVLLSRLAGRVRARTLPLDRAAADEVRTSGWARG